METTAQPTAASGEEVPDPATIRQAIAGLRTGAAILRANGKEVASVKGFLQEVKQKPPEKGLMLLVRLGSLTRYVLIKSAF